MKDLQIPSREAEIIVSELSKTLDIPGGVVEFGCYAGDTLTPLKVFQKRPPQITLRRDGAFRQAS